MAEHSTIEWTEASWNPFAGCSVHSPGCINCYAMKRVAPRLAKNPATPHYAGTVAPSKAGPIFTGVVNLASERVLTAPLRWKKPRMIFVNSTSDLFHENLSDADIDRVFAVMALCPQHTFQVLTKRSERMRTYCSSGSWGFRVIDAMKAIQPPPPGQGKVLNTVNGALPNVWLGVSAERQQEADARVPALLDTPAAVRFVSAEPLLGPIDFTTIRPAEGARLLGFPNVDALRGAHYVDGSKPPHPDDRPGQQRLDWIIVGGESGRDARPMHPAWARQIRDDCATADVPFFFKQWGEWVQVSEDEAGGDALLGEFHDGKDWIDGCMCSEGDGPIFKIGKKRAGRLLDGVEHNGMPVCAEVPAL
ncbi:MAG: phage Gp37/Gp68 family protein [Rhizobiaceae bacterium]